MRGLAKTRMKRDNIHTYIHTYKGHRDSMIESAQWADSMKIAEFVLSNSIGKNKEKKKHVNNLQKQIIFSMTVYGSGCHRPVAALGKWLAVLGQWLS